MLDFTNAVIALKAAFQKMTVGNLLEITFTFDAQTSAENAKEGVSRLYRDFAPIENRIVTLLGIRLRFKYQRIDEGEV